MKELVASGRYNNASEVVRDGLRLREEREKLREIMIAELRRLAEKGRLTGFSEDEGEAVLDRLEAKYRAMAADGPDRRRDLASAAGPTPISKRSPPTSHATIPPALSFVRELRKQCRRLAALPEAARLRPDLGEGVRLSVSGNYVILYVMHPDLMEIRRVVHGARNLTDID